MKFSLGLDSTGQTRNVPAATGPSNQISPVISGVAEVGNSLTVTAGTWVGSGAISYDYSWLRAGIDIAGANTNVYVLLSQDDLGAISCRVTASDNAGSTMAVSPFVTVTYPSPEFDSQPTLTPGSGMVGDIFTVSLGTASPNAPVTMEQFTLDGVDKSPELSNLTWDSTGQPAGTLVLQTSAMNSGGIAFSAIQSADLSQGVTVPDTFQPTHWSLTTAGVTGTLTLAITGLPFDGGSALTDIEYQIGATTWVSVGFETTGTFDLFGLVDNQQYSIKLRAINAFGASVESAPKIATPTGAETARFGTWNGTVNPAPFDASGAAADGTYGQFTVVGGVISPNTNNLIAGMFVVGGYPVNVDADTKAVSSQTEFNNAVANVGGLDGKIMVVRQGAEIGNAAAWYHSAIRRTVVNCTIVGDGNPSWEKTSFHFANVTFDNCSAIIWRNLSFRSFTIKSDQTYGPVQNAVWEDNHFGEFDPDANGDYSTTAYTGNDCFSVQNSSVQRMRVVNNTFRGGGRYAHILFWYTQWGELVGNHFDKYYADAIKIRGSAPLIVAANLATRPFSLASDAGNPHSDSIQIEGANGQSTDVYEANFFVRGNCRGQVSANLYLAGGPGFDGSAEGNGAISTGFYGNRAASTKGLVYDYNGAVPPPGFSGTVGNFQRNSIDNDPGPGTSLKNSFGGTVSAPASVAVSGNVEVQTWDNGTLAAALPGWALMTMDRPSYADALQAFVPAPGGSLDGKGPGAVVSLATGARAMDFQIGALRADPILSSISVTPATTSFSATLSSDTAKRPAFWAVVLAGQSIGNWHEIKERTIPGGLDYGFAAADSAGLITISGNIGSLASQVGYDLILVQENGWTARSMVARQAFTTT